MAFNSLKAKNVLLMFSCVLLLACLFCTSCSQKKEDEPPVTLTVWEADKGPDQFIQQAGEAFTALHPNITIKYVHVNAEDAYARLIVDGPSGIGADLFAAPHERLSDLVGSGLVEPTVNADKVKNKVLASCHKALTYNGTMYGYPVSSETYALFYNKELISENDIPKTWEELVEFSIKFNEANSGKFGFIMDVGNAYYTIMFASANQNRLFGASGMDAAHSNLNTPDSVKWFEFFQKNLREALDFPADDISSAMIDYAFSDGVVAMYITGFWNVGFFQDCGINFGVAPLPALPGEKTPCASFGNTRAMFVSSYSSNKKAAAEFAEFLLSPKMQRLRFELTGALPSANIKVESPYLSGFITQLEYAFPTPYIPQMSLFWEAFGTASQNIWDGADVKRELDNANAIVSGF